MDISTVDPRSIGADEFRDALAGADDLSTVEPVTFARLIARASDDQIAAVNAVPELRGRVLDEIVSRMRAQFRPDRAGDASGVVRWKVGDAPTGDGYDRFQLVIENGECHAGRELDRDPSVTITLGATPFLKLTSGNASPPMMFMTGKLKVSGDLGFAAGLFRLFDIPKP